MTNYKTLSEATSRLFGLLKDPHPGLRTWNEMLTDRGTRFQALAAEMDFVDPPTAIADGLSLTELAETVYVLKCLLDADEQELSTWQDAVRSQVGKTSQLFVNAGIPVAP